MEKKWSVLLIILMYSCFFVWADGISKGKPIQYNVAKGQYIPADFVDVAKLKKMPIPATNDDYAFYQSIGKRSNIIIGRFSVEPKMITLITDLKGDGTVDHVYHWYVEENKLKKETHPEKYCSAERFARMKEDILSGKSDMTIANKDGIRYLMKLIQNQEGIRSIKNGYRVSMIDTDDPSQERVVYYYADNNYNGVDLVFEVKYYNLGLGKVSPIVNHSVYCKGSFDPFAQKIVKQLLTETRRIMK